MRLRRYPEDDRAYCQLRGCTLELLEIRSDFLTRKRLRRTHLLEEAELKEIWNTDLQQKFLKEEAEFLTGGPPRKKKTFQIQRLGALGLWQQR